MAAQTLREAANLVIGALVVGLFLGGPLSPWLDALGGAMWFVLATAAILCTKEEDNG